MAAPVYAHQVLLPPASKRPGLQDCEPCAISWHWHPGRGRWAECTPFCGWLQFSCSSDKNHTLCWMPGCCVGHEKKAKSLFSLSKKTALFEHESEIFLRTYRHRGGGQWLGPGVSGPALSWCGLDAVRARARCDIVAVVPGASSCRSQTPAR